MQKKEWLNSLTERIIQAALEVKSVERLEPVHSAQLLSYLRLSGRKVWVLINFNVLSIRFLRTLRSLR